MTIQEFMDKVRPFGLATEDNEKALRTLYGEDRDITEGELIVRALSQGYLNMTILDVSVNTEGTKQ